MMNELLELVRNQSRGVEYCSTVAGSSSSNIVKYKDSYGWRAQRVFPLTKSPFETNGDS